MNAHEILSARANPNVQDYRTRYPVPIHWIFKKDEQFGMEYFGYLDLVRKTLKKYVQEGSAVFDIGCGDGKMSSLMIESGYDVTGFDFSPDAIGFAKLINRRDSFHVVDLEKESLPVQGQAGGIIMVEVLEHLHPKHYPRVLADIKSHLSDDGVFIVSLPSRDLPLNERWHYVHVEEKEFVDLMTENGWTIAERIYNYRLNHPAAWILQHGWRLLENKYWRFNLFCRLLAKWYTRTCNECRQDQKPARFIFVCKKS